jgi:hypothetical protein
MSDSTSGVSDMDSIRRDGSNGDTFRSAQPFRLFVLLMLENPSGSRDGRHIGKSG